MSGPRIGNPYASVLFPKENTRLYHEWGRTGYRRSLANYPWFADAKSGDIIVSERDSHRLQVFDCIGNETRFQPFGKEGPGKHEFKCPGGVTTTTDPNVLIRATKGWCSSELRLITMETDSFMKLTTSDNRCLDNQWD